MLKLRVVCFSKKQNEMHYTCYTENEIHYFYIQKKCNDSLWSDLRVKVLKEQRSVIYKVLTDVAACVSSSSGI